MIFLTPFLAQRPLRQPIGHEKTKLEPKYTKRGTRKEPNTCQEQDS
jgi:hypothetical protein